MEGELIKIHDPEEIVCSLQYMQKTSKLAVLFPGYGYGLNMPLFYFARKILMEHGYAVLGMNYGTINMDDAMLSTAVKRSLDILRKVDIGKYEDVLFISKSFGTLVAGESEAYFRKQVRHIFLTPLKETFAYMHQDACVALAGMNDEYISHEMLLRLSQEKRINLHLYEDATHSLEVDGNVKESVRILMDIVEICDEYIK